MLFNKLDHAAVGKIKPRFKLQTQEDENYMLELILTHANANG